MPMGMPQSAEPLLAIDDLAVEFQTDDGVVRAVDGVSYEIRPGEIVGVVGESGSGKSVTAMSTLGLVRPPGRITRGAIRFRGRDLRSMSARQLRRIRGGEIAMIFQDPMTALNPVVPVGSQIAEAVRLHNPGTNAAQVPSPKTRYRQYPHEYSGGMRQRAVIAMAIANQPALLIADEPTTALDVTIQAQVLELLRTAQRETAAATMLITHDLGVVAELADRIVVMYAGRVVEQGDVRMIFTTPRHPYTVGLMASKPRMDAEVGTLRPIPGSPPSLLAPPPGCPFHPRCALAANRDRCRTERPDLALVGADHLSACHFHDELVAVTP
jgi:oligopeptide/dipeptide ABC transporter ATP-binding protein